MKNLDQFERPEPINLGRTARQRVFEFAQPYGGPVGAGPWLKVWTATDTLRETYWNIQAVLWQ